MILYSLNNGKRLRPIISMDICNSLCQNPEKVLKFSLGLELIHTSCLIIDDMPCMDNDNYRRGELSFHKKYSERTAQLVAGELLSIALKMIMLQFSTANLKVPKMDF